jgi:hypothetical protein
MRHEPTDATAATVPKIEMPPIPPPTPEEIARRREVVERIVALRDKIGPIGISTAELIRQVREEGDGDGWHTLEVPDMPRKLNESRAATLPRIELPAMPPPTEEELRRRGEIVDRILARRDRIGPIGISTTDLIREVRDEIDGIDE